MGGALLIYLEFNAPGTIVPGALGTLMVLLAVFALNLLPIRYTAVLLLVAAMVLLVLEAKFGGHGALAIAGIVCLTFGMLTLVAAPVPEMGDQPAGRDQRIARRLARSRCFWCGWSLRARQTKGAHRRRCDGRLPGHRDGSACARRAMCWWRARSGGLRRARRWRRERVRVVGHDQMLLRGAG